MAKAAKLAAPVKSPKAPGGWSSDDLPMRIAWWSLLAAVFLVPLAISNFSWFTGAGTPPLTYDQFDIVKVFCQRLFGLIGLGAWAWQMLTKGGKVRKTPIEWLILGFFAWVLLTTFTSIHPLTALFGKYRRFEGFISFINYGVFFFLTLQLADTMARIRTLAQTLFWSGTLVSVYGVMQYLGIDPITWGQLPFEARRAFSTYGNPDLLGGFLVFALAIPLVLALSEDRPTWRAIYWGGFLITVWCWIVAFTRGAWIAGIVVFVVLAIALVRQKVKLNVVDWSAVGITGAAAAAIVGVSLRSSNDVMNAAKRVASIVQFDQGSSLTRFQIWQAAIAAIKARPAFGFGADTFRLVFPMYKPVEYVAAAGYLSVADNVHDYPLQLATGIGVIGVVLLYTIFGWTAFRSAKTSFARRPMSEGLVLAGFWAACAGYIVHLMFGLSVTGSTFLLWILMAAVLSPTASSSEFRPPSWGTIASVLVAAVVIVGLVFNVVYVAADHAYLQARLGVQGSDERVQAALKAVRLNSANDMYRAEVGLAYQDQVINAITQAMQQQQAGQDPSGAIKVAQERFDLAERYLLETIAFVRPEYDNYVFLSNLYNMGAQYLNNPGYYQKAIDIAERGIKVERYGPAIRFQYAKALLGTNKKAEAIKQLAYSLKMDPRFSDAAVLLSAVYKEDGDLAAAKKVLDDAVAAGVSSPDVQQALVDLTSTPTTPAP